MKTILQKVANVLLDTETISENHGERISSQLFEGSCARSSFSRCKQFYRGEGEECHIRPG